MLNKMVHSLYFLCFVRRYMSNGNAMHPPQKIPVTSPLSKKAANGPESTSSQVAAAPTRLNKRLSRNRGKITGIIRSCPTTCAKVCSRRDLVAINETYANSLMTNCLIILSFCRTSAGEQRPKRLPSLHGLYV